MSSNLLSKHELEEKIRVNAERLGQLTAPEDKRIKKRVLQTLGKLKKQLAEVTVVITSLFWIQKIRFILQVLMVLVRYWMLPVEREVVHLYGTRKKPS
jgi:hypothetical protein